MTKCNLCDERGMIPDPIIKGAAHSCPCGYHNYLMAKMFEGVDIGELLAYGEGRRNYKRAMSNQ